MSKNHFKFHFFTSGSLIYPLTTFSIFEIFVLLSKFLCLIKLLEAFKVRSSEGITVEQKISKSDFAKNITSNDLFTLPERQPIQSSSFSFFEIFGFPSNFLCFSKVQWRVNLALLKGLHQNRKFQNPFLTKISFQMTCLHFQKFNLSNACLFRFLKFFSYPKKFLWLSKSVKACKVSPSGRITTQQKISNSDFSQKINSNVIFFFWRINLPTERLFQFLTF